MTYNPHFAAVRSWKAARKLLAFTPLELKDTAGRSLKTLSIHVRDHKLRELAVADRTLEAHYGDFVFSQARKGIDEARRLALAVSYGPAARDAQISGHAARVYELGPEPPPEDIDGRMPAVVVWHDGEIFYLIASDKMPVEDLVRIASSPYRRSSGPVPSPGISRISTNTAQKRPKS